MNSQDNILISKIKTFLLLIVLSLFPLTETFALSQSFNTSISAVYPGPDGFGAGIFPLNTTWLFHANPQILPEDKFVPSIIYLSMGFNFNNSSFGGYEYNTGTPIWSLKQSQSALDWENRFGGKYYFAPSGNIDLSITQGFLTNFIEGSGNLFNLKIGLNSNYLEAREPIEVYGGHGSTTFIDPKTGTYTGIYSKFAPDMSIQAYPWLEGNRQNLSNYLYINFETIMEQYPGFGITDGFWINMNLKYGPPWLANNLTGNNTSDFLSFDILFQQKMALCSIEQPNGMNWFSSVLAHFNTFSFINGNRIPQHLIPEDRLTTSFGDTIFIRFMGPQFVTGDSYTFIDLGIRNRFLWGNIVNESPRTTQAMEFKSSLYAIFHLRLFGFMHFEYNLNYYIINGIQPWNPRWEHSAGLIFYITV